MSIFGSSSSTNDELVEEQKRQAAEADQEEQDLQARREQAVSDIDETYSAIGEDFYEGYRDSITDYYLQPLEDQYGDAGEQTFYNFARKGTARSTAYADTVADLAEDYEVEKANIYNQADQQTAELKNSTDREKQYAYELASTSENPTVAVNSATTSVNAVQNTEADTSPLSDVFDLAGLVSKNYYDAQRFNQYYGSGSSGSSNPFKSTGRSYG